MAGAPRKVVLIAESSTQSKIRINDYTNFRKYNDRREVFDTSLLRNNFGALATSMSLWSRLSMFVFAIRFGEAASGRILL
jgi:hypothetical protein